MIKYSDKSNLWKGWFTLALTSKSSGSLVAEESRQPEPKVAGRSASHSWSREQQLEPLLVLGHFLHFYTVQDSLLTTMFLSAVKMVISTEHSQEN